MSTDDQNRDDLTKTAASSQSVPHLPAASGPLDLSTVSAHTRRVVPARIDVRWDQYAGNSSTLAADAVITVAGKCGLKNPLPVALELYPAPGEERTLRAVPKEEQSEAWLNLDWYDQGRRFRSSFHKLLTLLKINIPRGTRMLINVAADHDQDLGHYIKLWWDQDAFLPINSEDGDPAD